MLRFIFLFSIIACSINNLRAPLTRKRLHHDLLGISKFNLDFRSKMYSAMVLLDYYYYEFAVSSRKMSVSA
jgi:hypothetical protein